MSDFDDFNDEKDREEITSTGEIYTEDSWAEKLKEKIEHSVSVWMASAFVDMRAVEMMKSIMDSVPPEGQREVRILLDNEFHSNPLARQAIINRLYELPNVKIRLAETEGKFHPKFYIFNEGSQTGCLIGSMNLTGAAITRNVEFGVFSYTREQVYECETFFREYWQKAREAPRTEVKDYPDLKFNLGESVIHIDSKRIGCVCEIKADKESNEFQYCVFFKDTEKEWFAENELDRFPAFMIQVPIGERYLSVNPDPVTLNQFIDGYLYKRYFIPASEGYYVAKTARIEDVWYQKIPLIKIATSPTPRLLIADEVGLGKTIEAGLIIREMIERMPACRKIVVICPNILAWKWKQEMYLRFNLVFNISTGKEVDAFLKKLRKGGEHYSFKEIITYESLQKKSLLHILDQINDENIRIDILVCDEAHHLRNNNLRQKAVRKLAYNNRCMIMLTATPINLSNRDIHALLGILDPQSYGKLDKDSWGSFIVPNVYITRLYASIIECIEKSERGRIVLAESVLRNAENISKRILKSELFGPLFSEDHKLPDAVNEVFEYFSGPREPLDPNKARDMADSIMEGNVFGRSITRTLKRDIGEFNTRDVKTVLITMKYMDEMEKFKGIIQKARKRYKEGKNKLAIHSVLRQASSCLPVMLSNDSDPIVDTGDYGDADGPYAERMRNIRIAEEQINEPDSKYEQLLEIIKEAREEGPDYKIIIFCLFIKTIKYLEERINREIGPNTVTVVYGGITDINERYRRINDFAKGGKPNILICSEIASEGIDLQFCHVLINYDMPWNPTKIEQRIGRIDRFGQKADVISIFNLVVEGTLEEVIYKRLGARLADARNTLGPIAEVLGNLESELPEMFLKGEFNEEEREKYEKTLEMNLQHAIKKQERQERESLQLTSLREEYMQQIKGRLGSSIDNVDIVGKYVVERANELFTLTVEEKNWLLNISRKHAEDLMKGLNRYLVSINQDDIARLLIGKLKSGKMPVVFNQEEAIYTNADFLSVDHPLIRYLLFDRRTSIETDRIYFFSSNSTDIPPGKYVITEYGCQIVSKGRLMDQVFSQSMFRFDGKSMEKMNGKPWLGSLFRFDKWEAGSKFEIPDYCLKDVINESKDVAESNFSSQHNSIKGRLEREIENARKAYQEVFFSEKRQLEDKIDTTVDPNKRNNLIRELNKIEVEIERSITRLPSIEDINFLPEMLFIACIERR